MGSKAQDPEGHFNSKIRHGTVRDQGTIISFTPKPFIPKKIQREKGLERITGPLKFSDFLLINEMHKKSIKN
jgi:hypothetical protein